MEGDGDWEMEIGRVMEMEREMEREMEMEMEMEREMEMDSHDQVPWPTALQKLHIAAVVGDWEAAKAIFDEDTNAKTATLSLLGLNALHVAASCGRSEFVEKLARLLTPSELEMRDQLGRTALHHVALAANVRAAKALVTRNTNLVQLGDMDLYTPLFYAARWRHPSKSKEMLEYLQRETKDEPPCSVYTAASASNLIVAITASGSHDIALRILEEHHELILTSNDSGMSILHVLAMQPSAFLTGSKLSLWDKFIRPWINNASAVQQRHTDSLKLVHVICKVLQTKSKSEVMNYFLPSGGGRQAVLHLATVHGVFELVKACLTYFPDLILYSSSSDRRYPILLLHVAIEHRRVDIFNHMIHLIGENTKAYADAEVDKHHNNVLHLAAKLAPTPQLHSVPGPAFQIQRELQWFKAVEALVYDEKRVAKNSKNQTPRELFFAKHEPLLTNAKGWMKDTSNSCMLVATLVATVAFAAMITVPGGNNNDTGTPILSKKKLFVVFSISNALSMISSAISLLMFLSVQTSRYTEEDFLESLPKILLKGLLFLFVAVATMMIAFGTAIGMALQTRVNWAYIPITVVACCPAIIFTKLQLPLLVQTLLFTSGPGVFEGQRDGKLWCLRNDDIA